MRKLLVSQAMYDDLSRGEQGDKIDGNVLRWVATAGYLPVSISNFLMAFDQGRWGSARLLDFVTQLDPVGLVLTGGADLGVFERRDQTETALVKWCRDHELPVFGICRGMQLLGVQLGGVLAPVQSHVATRHAIAGPDFNEVVNSYHNNGSVHDKRQNDLQ